MFAEITFHAAYEPQRAVRTRALQVHPALRQRPRRTGAGEHPTTAPSKDLLVAHGLGARTLPAEELYDLVLDPQEAANLAGAPHTAACWPSCARASTAWMAATDDPLLAGPVPVPPGAVVNDPSQTSPNDPLHSGSTL